MKKTVVYLTPSEQLKYNGYVYKVNISKSAREIKFYYKLADILIQDALKRQQGESH